MLQATEGAVYIDDIATGSGGPRLEIVGRPRPGGRQQWVILEEPPKKPVLMHCLPAVAGRKGGLKPHYTVNCEHCAAGAEEPKEMAYLGAMSYQCAALLGILELTEKCLRVALAESRRLVEHLTATDLFGERIAQARLRGMVVEISRGASESSPRVLRNCRPPPLSPLSPGNIPEWPYDTRWELARIWKIPVKPRLYKAEGQ